MLKADDRRPRRRIIGFSRIQWESTNTIILAAIPWFRFRMHAPSTPHNPASFVVLTPLIEEERLN